MFAVSLIVGWVPWLALSAGAVGMLFLLIVGGTRWRRLVGPGVAALVIGGATFVYFRVVDPLQYEVPPSFFAFFAAVVLGFGLAITGLRRGRITRRVGGVVAALAVLLAMLVVVNNHYAYFPTWAALTGRVSPFTVSEHEFDDLLQRASSGQLPSRGAVIEMEIPGAVSGFRARRAVVYLPPIWFAPHDEQLPVVMLLPGTPSSPQDWFRAGLADRTADKWARDHGGRAPILIVPDVNGSVFGDTECVDGPRGKAESYLVKDVRPYVIRELGAAPAADKWAVTGLSAGGTCAMTVALRHPHKFGTFANFSGDAGPNVGSKPRTLQALFGGDEKAWAAHDPMTILRNRSFTGMKARFEVGSGDRGPLRSAETVAAAAKRAGIDTTLVIRKGGHNYGFWSRAFENSITWLCKSLGLGAAG